MTKENYKINENTSVIMPARHTEYETTVMENDSTYHLRKKPLQVIEDGCIDHWSDYNGRRNAAIEHTGYQRKVPIIISIRKNIVAFPTQSPTNFECYWLFAKHIATIEKQSGSNLALVILKNEEKLPLATSFYILKKQYERTLSCVRRVNELR